MSLKSYWCFICQKDFTLSTVASECPTCHQQAFEEKCIQSKPQQFEVYQEKKQIQTNPPFNPIVNNFVFQMSNQQLSQFNQSLLNSLPSLLSNATNMIGRLMTQLQTSGNSYRPATSNQIRALQKIGEPKECAICQTEGTSQTGFKLPCGHQFHQSCLNPWFERANTCPTCRTSI